LNFSTGRTLLHSSHQKHQELLYHHSLHELTKSRHARLLLQSLI
jgi:hypothetical protein